MSEEIVARRYIYCAETDDKHKGKRSAYLIEQLVGSNVVARIKPVGLVNEATVVNEIDIYAIKNNLTLTHDWVNTKSGRYNKTRAILGKEYE